VGPGPQTRRAGAVKVALAIGLLGALSVLPLSLILVPGLIPTVVVLFIDRSHPRYLTYTVGAMNFAGTAPFLFAVIHAGFRITDAAAQLGEPYAWLVMYGAAAAGWLISYSTPSLARMVVELQIAQKRRALEALAAAVREEWGEEVAAKGEE
jgi:hypothetical protein